MPDLPPAPIPGGHPMSRRTSRVFVVMMLVLMAVFAIGGAYYVTRMATQPENRARVQATGPGNENAAPGFGVTDGAK
jgi:flagellar basal body-associated protein FliL